MDSKTLRLLTYHPMFKQKYATGSRVIVFPMPQGRDEYWVVLVANLTEAALILEDEGFKSDIGDKEKYKDVDFLSYRKGDLNLILTEKLDTYVRYVLATDVARKLNLKHRADRVALFSMIRDIGKITAEDVGKDKSCCSDYAPDLNRTLY